MLDEFTARLEFLFLSPDELEWVSDFDKLLDQWQLEACQRLLGAAKRRADARTNWIQQIKRCEGRYFLQLGQWNRAETAYREALTLLEDDDPNAVFEIASDLGLVQRLRGELKRARHNHQLCLSLAETFQWDDRAAECHIQLGLDYEMGGHLRLAVWHLHQAERRFQKLADTYKLVLARKALALVLIRQGQLAPAKALLQEILPTIIAAHELFHEGHIYGNLGNIAVYENDYQTAVRYYQQALERFYALGVVLEICGVLNNLAAVAYSQGEFEQARAYYEQSLLRAREIGSLSDERNVLANLSLLALAEGDYTAAMRWCGDALRVNRKLGDKQMAMRLRWRQVRLWLLQHLERLRAKQQFDS